MVIVRYSIRETKSLGQDYVFPYVFTTEKDATQALDIVPLVLDVDREDLYVKPINHIPSTNFDEWVALMGRVSDLQKERKKEKEERDNYLREHPEVYYNSELEEYVNKPEPMWSYVFDGWWRHITPEEFLKHKDYYQEYLKDSSGYMVSTLAVKAPSLMEKHLKETKECSVYEKSLIEGDSININDVGGYNSAEPDRIVWAEEKPKTVGQGMSGILMYDGLFYECRFSEHHKLIEKLKDMGKYPETNFRANDPQEEHAILFFSHGTGALTRMLSSSVSVPNVPIPEASKEWLRENMDYLSEDQKMCVERIFYGEDE